MSNQYMKEEFRVRISNANGTIGVTRAPKPQNQRQVFDPMKDASQRVRISDTIPPPNRRTVEVLHTMDGKEFEFFCRDLLKEIGFSNLTLTPGSGDQGVDIMAVKDDVKYAFQCKCYSFPVDNGAVQEVYAGKSYYDCQVAVVITNSTFTNGAIRLAEKLGVVLWDSQKLQSLSNKIKSEKAKKLQEESNSPLSRGWNDRYYRANEFVSDCIKNQEKPTWIKNSSEAVEFCCAVRMLVKLDKYPLPTDETKLAVFDVMSLALARAGEKVNCIKKQQLQYAVLFHELLIEQEGSRI